MPEPTTCPVCPTDLTYCDNCDLLVGLEGLHVIDVTKTGRDVLVVTVESAPMVMGCPTCGVDRALPRPSDGDHGRHPLFQETDEGTVLRQGSCRISGF